MGIPVLKPSGLVKLWFDRSELMVMRTFDQRRFSFVRVLGYDNFVILSNRRRNSRNNLESSGKSGGYSSFFYIRKFENLEENLLILAKALYLLKCG